MKKYIHGYEQIEAIQNNDENNNLWNESDVLRVKKDGKYGLVDFKGTKLVDCDYSEIVSLKGTRNSLLTTKDGMKGIIDDTGDVILDNEYKSIQAISSKYENGYIVQGQNGKYGVMNWSKTVAVEAKYETVKPIYGDGNYYVVKENGKFKIIEDIKNVPGIGESKFEAIKDEICV